MRDWHISPPLITVTPVTALALLVVVCIVTYTIEIVFGLAGTILMLAIMSFVYDSKTLVIYSILPQILVGIIGLARSPRTVELRVLAGMLGAAVVGAVAGLYLFYVFPLTVFELALACAITVFGVYLVSAPDRVRLNGHVARALDVVAGFSQALFGISGPITMARLLGTVHGGKTHIRNYALAFFLSLNLFRAGGYLIQGTITPEVQIMMLVSGPVLVVSLWFSNHLHFHVNERVFRRVVTWMILLGGVSLLVRAV